MDEDCAVSPAVIKGPDMAYVKGVTRQAPVGTFERRLGHVSCLSASRSCGAAMTRSGQSAPSAF